MENTTVHNPEHRDDEASRIGMWLFIFSELLFFGGLFIVYSVYRFRNQEAFHLAATELNRTVGTINTIILMFSSMTLSMSVTSMQRNNKRLTLGLLFATIILGIVFIINKYFEWGLKIEHGLYPGSAKLHELGYGDTLFFGLYFAMTGLHLLHLLIGIILVSIMIAFVLKDKIRADKFVQLDNIGLYWHLVDIIWIFLFPLFYLIT
jgi:cytochrome c oxidase subunit III